MLIIKKARLRIKLLNLMLRVITNTFPWSQRVRYNLVWLYSNVTITRHCANKLTEFPKWPLQKNDFKHCWRSVQFLLNKFCDVSHVKSVFEIWSANHYFNLFVFRPKASSHQHNSSTNFKVTQYCDTNTAKLG